MNIFLHFDYDGQFKSMSRCWSTAQCDITNTVLEPLLRQGSPGVRVSFSLVPLERKAEDCPALWALSDLSLTRAFVNTRVRSKTNAASGKPSEPTICLCPSKKEINRH